MTRVTMGTAAGLLALTLAACATEASGPVLADAQHAHLVQRTQELAASVMAAGRLADDDRIKLAVLARDVQGWRVQHGLGDPAASTGSGLHAGITLASSRGGGTGTCAGVCVPVVVMGDLICFISGYTCIGGQKRCLYECTFNLDALPARRV